MRPRDLRLVPLATAVWGVALVCVFVPGSAWACVAFCGAAAVSVVALFAVRWRRLRGEATKRVGSSGLLVVILTAGAAVAMAVVSATPARDRASEWDGRVVELTAEITSSGSPGQDGRIWFEAITSAIGPPGRPTPLAAPVRIGIEPAEGFDLGARIRVKGEASATDPGERSALVVFAREAKVLAPPTGVFGAAAELRLTFVERSLRLPEPGAGLLPGLAVGDTRAVSTELSDDMRTSGLSHLTAVSGANCAIVVGAVFWLTALCGGGRMLRVMLAVTALAGFVVLVTPEPSVIRAAVMAGVAMLTVLLGRPSAGAGLLALCAVGILLADPWLAATPGFALSVVASGALILLAPPLSRGLTRWMPAPVALAVAVPLAAQLACGPIIALFADQQSLIGVAANLIAAPAAPVATVIGLLACLAAPVPLLADLLAAWAWLPAEWIATTATTAARLPVAELLIPAGVSSALLVLGVSASLAVVLIGARGGGTTGGRTARVLRTMRRSAAAVLIVVVTLAGAGVVMTGPLATVTVPDGWTIAACDVGQGDALLVRSGDQVALIDTGPDPKLLGACLTSLGVTHIDMLVLSHFDLDHVGGTDAVYGKVEEVLHGPTAEPTDQRLLDDLAAHGARLTEASAGQRGTLGSTAWRVLWPLRDSAAFPPGNDASVVMEFDGGDVPRSLFLGDLSAEAQRMLQRSARLGTYSVVKVAHHGSADQEPELYEALDPAAAIFSAGAGNDYGHPREDALDMLRVTGSLTLRTDTQGRILLGIHEEELQIWTERTP